MSLRPIVISQSITKAYLSCRRLYGWARIENLSTPVRKSSLEIGTAVHAALAVFHSADPKKEALGYLVKPLGAEEEGKGAHRQAMLETATLAAMPEAKEALAVHTAVTMLTERAGIQSAFEDKSLDESAEITRRTLEGYFEHWGAKGQLWKPLGQEVEFLVEVQPGWWETTFGPESVTAIAGDAWGAETALELQAEWTKLPRSGVFLRGRADNLAVVPGVGLYNVDYKTAGRNDPRDMLKYELDMQLTFYIYGITKQLTEDAVKQGKPPLTLQGAIIDALIKTKVPQYLREIFGRSAEELTEFEHEIAEYGSEMRVRHDRVEAGEDWKRVFGKRTEQCFQYGVCVFRSLCCKDTDARRAEFGRREADYVDSASASLMSAWKA